jgi:two-component system LytT family response regulator
MSLDRLRLLVADDEPLARDLVRQYAASVERVEIVAEATCGEELAEAVERTRPDAALVDVRMPGEDVFAVLARRAAADPPLPSIIFATAYDRYAVRAFDMNAVDYLVKPYTADRFAEAIRRVRTRKALSRTADAVGTSDGLTRVIRDLGPRPDRLLVPDGRRMVPIAVADIAWIKAEGDYARVYAGGRSYLVSRTLKELEGRLDPFQFLRIHRSAIVQTSHIREVTAEGSSRYRVRLDDGTTVIVSRTRAPDFKKWTL